MKLGDYLKALKAGEKRIVNCYDQAYAVITLAAAVGIETSWVFMQPYGFINLTNLVGVGTCNNPFYNSDPMVMRKPKTPPGTKPTDLVHVPGTGRSYFWNHAFVNYIGKIYDACAGPHRGTEYPDEYVKDAIDVSRDYYCMDWITEPKIKPHGSDMEPPIPGYVTNVI